ncbi:MAG: hypothetical protein WC683_11750 [bacterium]
MGQTEPKTFPKSCLRSLPLFYAEALQLLAERGMCKLIDDDLPEATG